MKYKDLGLSESLFKTSLNEKKEFSQNDQELSNESFKNSQVSNRLKRNSSDYNTKQFQTLKKTSPLNTQLEVSKNDKTKGNFFNNSEMTPSNLRKFLSEFKRFPEKNRSLIWKVLLDLPENIENFDKLKEQGIHPLYQNLENNFPLNSQGLYKLLQKILSLLGYHCPFFTEIDYFPALVFPFIKVLGNNEILCFETILTFMMNWAKELFESFPDFPIVLLETIEDLLKFHDYDLYRHFMDNNIQLNNLIWPVLQTNFTGILAREDWLVFMDHVFAFSGNCAFYIMFLISYICYFRNSLLALQDVKGFSLFFDQQNAINIEKVLENTTKYLKATPKDLIPSRLSTVFSSLSSPEYPEFTYYPQITADYHYKLREKIAKEQQELTKRRQKVAQLSSISEELIERERKYRKRQETMIKLEQEKRERLLREESIRVQKKLEEDRQFRNKRIEQLKILENTITSSLRNQEKLREDELVFLQKELESRKNIEEFLLESRLEEEALLGLEFSMNQKVQEIIEMRNREERQRKLKQELEFKAKQEEFEAKLQEERWKNEDLEMNLKRELLKQQKLLKLNEMEERTDDENIKQKLLLETLEKELKVMELERERKLRQLAEEETLKNEKLIETFKQQEELARKEDEKHLRTIMNNEKQTLSKKYSETIQKIEKGNIQHENELEMHRQKLREIASIQKKSEFEAKVIEIKRENDLKLLEEERKLQKILLDQEKDAKLCNELKESLAFKEEECKQRDLFYRSLKENQEKLLKNEKVRFEEYRKNYKEEMEKLRKTNDQISKDRLLEYEQRQKDEYHYDPKASYSPYNSNSYENNFNQQEQGSLYTYSLSNASDYKHGFNSGVKEKKEDILIQENDSHPSHNYNMSLNSENYDNKAMLDPYNNYYGNSQNLYSESNAYSYNKKLPYNEQVTYESNEDESTKKNNYFQFNGKHESLKNSYGYSGEEEKISPEFQMKNYKNQEKYEENNHYEENDDEDEDNDEEKLRRPIDVDLDKPKYRSHSNTPDRYEVLEEEADNFN